MADWALWCPSWACPWWPIVCDPAFCLSALRIMCTASHTYSVLLSPASTVCVRPARRPSGHCHARPSARVSSTGLETQGSEASLLLLQRNLVLAPLRSAITVSFCSYGSFFCRQTEGEKLAVGENFFYPPGGCFFCFFCRLRRCMRTDSEQHPAPTSVPVRVCGTQAPASEMGTGNSASHLRVCRTNLDG